jgi:hypothetical protein
VRLRWRTWPSSPRGPRIAAGALRVPGPMNPGKGGGAARALRGSGSHIRRGGRGRPLPGVAFLHGSRPPTRWGRVRGVDVDERAPPQVPDTRPGEEG